MHSVVISWSNSNNRCNWFLFYFFFYLLKEHLTWLVLLCVINYVAKKDFTCVQISQREFSQRAHSVLLLYRYSLSLIIFSQFHHNSISTLREKQTLPAISGTVGSANHQTFSFAHVTAELWDQCRWWEISVFSRVDYLPQYLCSFKACLIWIQHHIVKKKKKSFFMSALFASGSMNWYLAMLIWLRCFTLAQISTPAIAINEHLKSLTKRTKPDICAMAVFKSKATSSLARHSEWLFSGLS